MNATQIEPPVTFPPLDVPCAPGDLPHAQSALVSNGLTAIRRFCQSDAPLLFTAARESIDELCAWMVWCRPEYSLADSTAFIASSGSQWERGESFSFVIFDAVDGTFLGSAGLNQINRTHNMANLGYWVRSGHTGRGIASVAVRLVARYGLRELGFNRLDIVVPIGNLSSQRVAEKAGARREGLLRRRLVLQGKACDAVLYSLVAEDFEF